MAGYDWSQGKSKNAVYAEECNIITKTALATKLKVPGVVIDKASFIEPCEWHHTGKYFNETDYYDLEGIQKQLTDNPALMLELQQLKLEYQKKRRQQGQQIRGVFRYKEWYQQQIRGGNRWSNKYWTFSFSSPIKGIAVWKSSSDFVAILDPRTGEQITRR